MALVIVLVPIIRAIHGAYLRRTGIPLPTSHILEVSGGEIALRKCPGLYVILSWLMSGAAFNAIFLVHYRAPGGLGASVRYFSLIASLCLSLVISARRTPRWMIFVFLPVLGIPLLGAASFLTAPSVGYGGQILMFAVRTILLAILASIVLADILHGSAAGAEPVDKVLVSVHLAVVLAGLLSFNGLSLMPSVQHGADPVEVRHARLGSTTLSYPLVEEGQAFVMDQSGFLHQVDLKSMKVVARIKLPMPGPAEAGYPDFAKPPSEEAARPEHGRITRLGSQSLLLEYPFNMGRSWKDDTGYGWAQAGAWHLEAQVELGSRQVTSWRVTEGSLEWEPGYPHPVQAGLYKAVWGDYRESLHVVGPGVDTRIWPVGWVKWLISSGPHVLAGTDRGALYVITLPER